MPDCDEVFASMDGWAVFVDENAVWGELCGGGFHVFVIAVKYKETGAAGFVSLGVLS